MTGAQPKRREPLELAEFERLLAAGHGRAALDLRVHGLRDRAGALRVACVRNLAYDPQIECDRGPWILGMLDAVGGPEPWMADILAALPATECDHDALQLAQILDLIAQRGDERARAVTESERRLARFEEPDEDGIDWTLGPWPVDVDTKAFIATPDEPEAPPIPSVNQVRKWVDELANASKSSAIRGLFPRGFFLLDELPFAARAVELLDHSKPWVRSKAAFLVERMHHPSLREKGFRRIRESGFSSSASSMLMRNLEAGDVALLESLLPGDGDVHAEHDAAFALCSLAVNHRRDESWRPLQGWIYERSPCENCRNEAVRHLAEWPVTDEMRGEWHLDSHDDTRRLGS